MLLKHTLERMTYNISVTDIIEDFQNIKSESTNPDVRYTLTTNTSYPI